MKNPIRLFYRGFEKHDHIDVEIGDDSIGYNIMKSFQNNLCPNCGNIFESYSHEVENPVYTIYPNSEKEIHAVNIHTILHCGHCGWWQLKQIQNIGDYKANWAYQFHGILENIDISKNNIATEDIRRHLKNNWDDRKYISAKKAEDLVRSILKEHLSCDVYHSTANVNSPDGGIDLFVCSTNGKIISAVQVKRRITDKKESVSEVRNFVGALVLEGYNKGVFITTAKDFTKSAKQIQSNPQLTKYKLELDMINGSQLLELLHAQEPPDKYDLPLGLTLSTKWLDKRKTMFTLEEILKY
ncbi:MAG: restriction endonuclease [Prolixibacteraceae bacterium]